MFESLGLTDTTPQQASVLFGLLIGAAFGALAEITRFCIRRGLVGPRAERKPALGVWLTALALAVVGTQASVAMGWITFADHRFLAADLAWLAIALGGLAFGAGMVLTRGCVSRLTVLTASGNLRALTVLLVFAITAHATLKGGLSGLRTGLAEITLPMGEFTSLAALPGGAVIWSVAIAVAALAYGLRSGAATRALALAALIGLLVPLGWVGTGFILFDEFDPIALESLSFTAPATETLFWTIAGTAVPAGFGTGLFAGVLAGALASALIAGRFAWQSFESPAQTGRYLAGAVLMGFGGVLAGGCTVGAGLSGVPTLSFAALLALGAIVVGAKLAHAMLRDEGVSGSGAQPAKPSLQPAE